jgi:hypothetical protein
MALLFTWLGSFESEVFWTGYLAGGVFGILAGPLAIVPMKRRIVDGRVMMRRAGGFAFRTYWKIYLVMAVAVVVWILLARELTPAMDSFYGFTAGLFAGMILYFFVWVLVYEKRHNVRLRYADEDEP